MPKICENGTQHDVAGGAWLAAAALSLEDCGEGLVPIALKRQLKQASSG